MKRWWRSTSWRIETGSISSLVRLLRREVAALVKQKHGGDYLMVQQTKTELAGVNRELKRLKTQIAVLEARKAKLIADRPCGSARQQIFGTPAHPAALNSRDVSQIPKLRRF